MVALHDSTLVWNPPVLRDILTWPLPDLGAGDRLLLRALSLLARRHVRAIHGLEHLSPGNDPFILVGNHSTRREAVLLPSLLIFYRGGRLVHFLADWNFRMIPGIGLIYRRAGTISVARKSARPRFLNFLKPLFVDSVRAEERARQHLALGKSVGIFVEGTVNRDPRRLLAGRSGAARLSLEAGVPVVPMGIRYPEADPTRRIVGPMEVFIGPPRVPPSIESSSATLEKVRSWHAVVMTDVAMLSGKAWQPRKGDRR